jgi:hypothetical protein
MLDDRGRETVAAIGKLGHDDKPSDPALALDDVP